MRKRILIIGPIGDFGGRELEAGFIAKSLEKNFEVTICSTGDLTMKSQVFDFVKNEQVCLVKRMAFKNNLILKITSFLSFIKNKRKHPVFFFVNNEINKKYFKVDEKIKKEIRSIISKHDLIFICAQLSSNYTEEIINYSNSINKPILFRTTGTITFSDYNFIDLVDCFIHHSYINASNIKKINKFVVIDQSANNELELLDIPLSHREVCNFLILSRLSHEKGVEEIIDMFLRVGSEKDILFIAGNGALEKYLRTKYEKSNNVKFLGFLNGSKLSNLFKLIDCLIIPSPEESGPLVGIESMCAAKIMVSTRVGAMQERLQGTSNDYWFDYNNFESFEKVFLKVKDLNEAQIRNISAELRKKYEKEYSIDKISDKYLKIVGEVLSICV